MNSKFAKIKIDKIAEEAEKSGNGFIGIYFDRKEKKFIGNSAGMTQNDAVQIIEEIINNFRLNPAELARFINPPEIALTPDNSSGVVIPATPTAQQVRAALKDKK